MKRGIISASFGTSHKDARERSLESIENAIADAFNNDMVTGAYTSGMVINKILENEGLRINSLSHAINQLLNYGVDEIYVQPLHMIPGHEYDKLKIICETFPTEGIPLYVGEPLLYKEEDFSNLASAIECILPDEDDGQAVILAGHGTRHAANSSYKMLDDSFKDLRNDVIIVNIEGHPPLKQIEDRLKGMDRVFIAPLMVVAGNHATLDIAGERPDSMKSRLEAMDLKVRCLSVGLGENPRVRDLYINKLKELMKVKRR